MRKHPLCRALALAFPLTLSALGAVLLAGMLASLVPGWRAYRLSLADGLRIGGTFTFAMVALLVALDELESAALSTLAPDIANSLGISDGVIVAVGTYDDLHAKHPTVPVIGTGKERADPTASGSIETFRSRKIGP